MKHEQISGGPIEEKSVRISKGMFKKVVKETTEKCES